MFNDNDILKEANEMGRFWSRTAPLYSLPLMAVTLASAISINEIELWVVAAFMLSVWTTWFIWGWLSDRHCRKLEEDHKLLEQEYLKIFPAESVNIDKNAETKRMPTV